MNAIIENLINKLQVENNQMQKILEGKEQTFCIINADPDDAGSKIYLKNKINLLSQYGIDVAIENIRPSSHTLSDVKNAISQANEMSWPTILQLPIHPTIGMYTDELINRIDFELDIDGFRYNCAPFGKKQYPITSEILYYIVKEIVRNEKLLCVNNETFNTTIYLRGMGKTTNKPLLDILLQEKFHILIGNSKTTKAEDIQNCSNAQIIISATGKIESLPDVAGRAEKYLISPTVLKDVDGKWKNDVPDKMRPYVCTHKVTGTIGKCTLELLANRILRFYIAKYNYTFK